VVNVGAVIQARLARNALASPTTSGPWAGPTCALSPTAMWLKIDDFCFHQGNLSEFENKFDLKKKFENLIKKL
jgi:hypothetical protein